MPILVNKVPDLVTTIRGYKFKVVEIILLLYVLFNKVFPLNSHLKKIYINKSFTFLAIVFILGVYFVAVFNVFVIITLIITKNKQTKRQLRWQYSKQAGDLVRVSRADKLLYKEFSVKICISVLLVIWWQFGTETNKNYQGELGASSHIAGVVIFGDFIVYIFQFLSFYCLYFDIYCFNILTRFVTDEL